MPRTVPATRPRERRSRPRVRGPDSDDDPDHPRPGGPRLVRDIFAGPDEIVREVQAGSWLGRGAPRRKPHEERLGELRFAQRAEEQMGRGPA